MTLPHAARAVLAAGLLSLPLSADFSYQETARITGGAMVSMMKFAGAFSKDARKATQPIESSVSIKGNRMLRKSPDNASIIDLDQQTITTIHYPDRTYSVLTFEQMRQQMEAMAAKMKQSGPAPAGTDASFEVKVNDTHQHRTIAGQDTHEVVLTMLMSAKDQKSSASAGLDMTTDMWIAPGVPGYQEVRDFHKRMAQKLSWVPGANPLINRPDMVKAMAELYSEQSKFDGMPLESIVRMGGRMDGVPADNGGENSSRQQQSSPPPTSVSGALAGALGGRFGMGRKKKQEEPAEGSSNGGSTGQTQSASGSLMEMTTSVSSHSTAPVDATVFDIPAGFSKIEEDLANPSSRRHR